MSYDFYASGSGDNLVDDRLLPEHIKVHLADEDRLLDRALREFDSLVELGSMHGLHLEFAVRRGKPYVGLDIVERYVAEGDRRLAELGLSSGDHRFLVCDIADLARVPLPAGPLAFSPFNCLGNISDLTSALHGLKASGVPFLLSSYRTDTSATERRREYYAACGHTGVRVRRDDVGVRFTSAELLDSIAYEPDHLLGRFAEVGLAVRMIPFGAIGAAYASTDVAEALTNQTAD